MLRRMRGKSDCTGFGRRMAQFWSIFKLVWLERMAYRFNFFMQVLSGVLSSLIVIFLWMAIYRSAGREAIGGYSLGEMVTYLFGGGLINSFVLSTAENPETSQNIRDGTLSFLFLQPISPYGVWFIRDLGGKAFYLLLGLVSFGLFAVFFRDYLILSLQPGSIFLFLLAIVLAALLHYFFFEALSLLSFWIENTYGLRFTMRVIMEVLAGVLIPLSFFPVILQEIFSLLPFRFLIYFPMEIYLGKVAANRILYEFLKEGGWILGLAAANWAIWKKGVRQYVAMGD